MNEVKDVKDIEQVYTTMLEKAEVGKDPKALGDSEEAGKLAKEPNSPSEAEGVKDIVKPEDGEDDNALYLKKISERLKESKQKAGKIAKENINNFTTMSEDNNKNIFDRLYSTIMEGEDPFDELSMDAELGDEGDLEPEEGLGEEEVTLSLPRDLAESLLDALKGQLDNGEDDLGDDLGDEFGEEPMEDEFIGDAVVSQPEPKDVGGAGPAMAGNKGAWKPKGKTGTPGAGTADKGSIKEDPTPKDLGGHGDREHPDAGNTASGSNKVNNPKTKHIGD